MHGYDLPGPHATARAERAREWQWAAIVTAIAIAAGAILHWVVMT